MHQGHQLTPARQRGITLLESLVAIVVAALGILGIVGVQMRTLADTQTSVRRAQAIRLIEDLGERMKVNPNALANLSEYVSNWAPADTPTADATPHCAQAACTHAQLAVHDLAEWKQAVERTLPLGNARTFLALGDTNASNRRQLGVLLRWRENEATLTDNADRARYADALNAGASRKADGSVSDKDPAACPADFTCHLQYIPVAARCAPYLADATVQYFCPGG